MKYKNKLFFISIYCVIILIIIFSFFIFSKLRVEKKEIFNNISALDKIEKNIADGKDDEKLLSNLEKEKYTIEKMTIANQEDLAVFIKYLESLASTSLVSISLESIQPPQSGENYNFSLNIKAEGFFIDLNHFINALENSPYLVFINSLVLEKKASVETESYKGARNKWSAKINLEIISFSGLK